MSKRVQRVFGHASGERGAVEVVRPSLAAFWHFILIALVGSYLMRFLAPHTVLPALVPIVVLAEMLRRYLDCVMVLGAHRILSIRGRLSLRIEKPVIRYSDIRAIGVSQGVMGRLLGYGSLSIGTAGTGGIEIVFDKVGSPRILAEYLEEKRRRSSVEMHRGAGVVSGNS